MFDIRKSKAPTTKPSARREVRQWIAELAGRRKHFTVQRGARCLRAKNPFHLIMTRLGLEFSCGKVHQKIKREGRLLATCRATSMFESYQTSFGEYFFNDTIHVVIFLWTNPDGWWKEEKFRRATAARSSAQATKKGAGGDQRSTCNTAWDNRKDCHTSWAERRRLSPRQDLGH